MEFNIAANGKMKLSNILQMANRREKRGNILDSGLVREYKCASFDLIVFNVTLGWFTAVLQYHVARKKLAIEQKGFEIWDSKEPVEHM